VSEWFSTPLRVRYGECDAQGVVFNAHYLSFLDVGLTELWRTAFGSWETLTDHGVDLMMAEIRVQFRAPGRFDDELDVQLAIERLGTTSLMLRHRIRRGEQLLIEGEARHVMVDRQTWQKTELPTWVREGLTRWVLPAA
jgi:acyl-CoA thioester hydrolase